jgi:hypothetical protein
MHCQLLGHGHVNGNQISNAGVPFHTADAKQLNQEQPNNKTNNP